MDTIVGRLDGLFKTPWLAAYDQTIDEVLAIYAETKESCRKVAAYFNRIRAHELGETASKTFVAELIKNYHYRVAQVGAHCKHRVPPPLPINDTWGMDATGKGDEAGTVHAIVAIIDHGSRLALALHPLRKRDAAVMLGIVITAIAQFGKPHCIRTDNDGVFRSRIFRRGLAKLDIRHRLSKPGHPWQNGRVERLFLTLKEKLNRLVVSNFEALDQALVVFRGWYNEIRPHDHLGGATPLEAWRGIDPYKLTPKAVELFTAWGGLLTGYYLRR